jgi:hypothetical protein
MRSWPSRRQNLAMHWYACLGHSSSLDYECLLLMRPFMIRRVAFDRCAHARPPQWAFSVVANPKACHSASKVAGLTKCCSLPKAQWLKYPRRQLPLCGRRTTHRGCDSTSNNEQSFRRCCCSHWLQRSRMMAREQKVGPTIGHESWQGDDLQGSVSEVLRGAKSDPSIQLLLAQCFHALELRKNLLSLQLTLFSVTRRGLHVTIDLVFTKSCSIARHTGTDILTGIGYW